MRQPAITWTPAHDAALTDLLHAWHRLDDLRRSPDFAARSEALLELEHARRAFREAGRQPVLAA
jgi:hypothetical protein